MRIGDRVILRGQRWTVLETTPYADCETVRLARLAGSAVGTFILPFDRPRSEFAQRDALRVVRPRRALHHLRRAAARVHPFGGLVTAASDSIDLLGYQLAPAIAMLRHGWSRLLIADDPGLGKTIQAGVIAAELCARSALSRVLILAPAGLRSQWTAEMAVRFHIDVTSADSSWLKAIGATLPAGTNPWMLPGVYLASHDFVKRPEVLRPLEDVVWDLLIVDEAHGVTIGTDRRSAADALACRARRVVLLTATPHEADPAQQAALTRIGATSANTPWLAFRRSRWMVAPGPERRSRIVLVRPDDGERRMQRLLEEYTRRIWREATARGDPDARLASIVLRKRALSSAGSLAVSIRRRMDLLADSPPPGAQQMPLPLGDEDPIQDVEPVSVLAAPGLGDARLETRWLAAILETARHAALHESKLRALLRVLGRVREPAIVFTEYRDTLARLRAALKARGVDAAVLHGGMSVAERDLAQQALNTNASVLLATDAAAEGLNLQVRCRIVIHYELPWNPARLEQRAGRVDRIGQGRRVHEMALVADDTAERLVLEPIVRRARRARRDRSPGLFHAFAEPRIAAAILGDQPLECDNGGTVDSLASRDHVVHAPGLRDEARLEAARAGRCREWRARSGQDRADDDPPNVTAIRSRPRRGSAVFVYKLSIQTGDVLLQHAELVALRVDGLDARIPGSAAAVRTAAERARSDLGQEVGDRLDRLVAERAGRVSAASAVASERSRARERAIAETRASAARRLVQRGLFDRPSRRAPAPEAARNTGLDNATTSPDLDCSTELVAIFLWR